jgi:hypothetical protein
MLSILDFLEPERKSSKLDPLCPVLYNNKNPLPFKRAYANDVYVVLGV